MPYSAIRAGVSLNPQSKGRQLTLIRLNSPLNNLITQMVTSCEVLSKHSRARLVLLSDILVVLSGSGGSGSLGLSDGGGGDRVGGDGDL